MIEQEQDSVFKLTNAYIIYNPTTDIRFRYRIEPNNISDPSYKHQNDIIINKHLELNNVQFLFDSNTETRHFEGVLNDILFHKSISLTNSASFIISNCRFKDDFNFSFNDCSVKIPQALNGSNNSLFLINSSFKGKFNMSKFCVNDDSKELFIYFDGNSFSSKNPDNRFFLNMLENRNFMFQNNTIKYEQGIYFSNRESIFTFSDNKFISDFILITNTDLKGKITWENNFFSSKVLLETDPFKPSDVVDWNQLKDNFISYEAFTNYTIKVANKFPVQLKVDLINNYKKQYLDSVRYYDKNAFTSEIGLKGIFYNYYKNRYNTEIANEVYLELKDYETQRLKILYQENPTFRTFFKWKVNQFLKLFSDYGTEPSKAIVFSFYVILCFALIYLFFPNSWDKHGKNRILDRYTFFIRYMKKDAGIHEVYLEDKQTELMEYEEYKNLVLSSEKAIPKFFSLTALPLYKWAVSGTKFTTTLLKRVDIMKGTWQELPSHQRLWKSLLLVCAFIIAIVYDLFIKVLNALMLSINTFTTLGFGEIPIKGLPRYLAIIQGFIGWFMLTIFSVSLISQLLN